MQSEKEFKELGQCWADDCPIISRMNHSVYERSIESILELMWRSYNQAIEDYVRQDS